MDVFLKSNKEDHGDWDCRSAADAFASKADSPEKLLNVIRNLCDGIYEVVACTGTARSTLGTKVPLDQTLSGWVTLHNLPIQVR